MLAEFSAAGSVAQSFLIVPSPCEHLFHLMIPWPDKFPTVIGDCRIVAGKWSASPPKNLARRSESRAVMSIAQGHTQVLAFRGMSSLLSTPAPDDPVTLRLHES